MPLLTASDLAAHFAGLDDDALGDLLRARPDLLHPTPADFLSLAVRAQSELSLRQHLQRLDAHTLRVLLDAAERAASTEDRPVQPDDGTIDPDDERADHDNRQTALARLRAHGLVLPASPPQAPGNAADPPASHTAPEDHDADDAPSLTPDAPVSVPAHLPHVLDSLRLSRSVSRVPSEPPSPTGPQVPSTLVQNASLSAVGELLSAVEDLLAVLNRDPAVTLRTGGVGMRELRRLSAARSGERRTEDSQAGETGWLLELAAAASLIALDVDTGRWRPTESAERWRAAPRHRRHQLLVSGWLLSPRSPLLLRGPHPSARIAPALTQDRQRGDAPALRERLLRTASSVADEGRRIWELDLPDGDLPPAGALRGVLADRLTWERPLLISRVRPLLAPMVREAERLGLLAAGTVSLAGAALVQSSSTDRPTHGDPGGPPPDEPLSATLPLSAMAAAVAEGLPPLSETVHVQSDLTAVPTGPLAPELERALSQTAEKETRGGVPTYRFTTASVRTALTRNWTPESLTTFLRRHSSGELPSPLRALIDDAARHRRAVRIGGASSWLVERDPEARAELLAQPELQRLGLHPLGEGVLVCEASPAELATALRDCGVPALREDEDASERHDRSTGLSGQELPDFPEGWTLLSSPWQQAPVRTITPETLTREPELLEQTIASLRAASTGRHTGLSPASAGRELAEADVVATLRDALRRRRPVRIRRAGADGEEHTITGVPTGMNAGRVRLRKADREEESVLLLHRVTSVTPAGEGAGAAGSEGMPGGTRGVAAGAPHRSGEESER